MAVGKSLKILGLAGGGILALGSGAAGTHFAHPYLEAQFNPSRKNREEWLRQSYGEKQEEIEFLLKELSEQGNINELQEQNIGSLKKSTDDLKQKIDDKDQEISRKTREIETKDNEIADKIRVNQQQQKNIDSLNGQITQKNNELKTETAEKEKVKNQLDYIEQRLALTKENILTQQVLNMNLLKIEQEKIEFKNFDGTWAKFEVTERNGNITEIKVNKEKPTNHEQAVEKIREIGIPFKINSDDFGKWNKEIKLVMFDACYDCRASEEKNQRNYLKRGTKVESTLKLTDYFQDSYLQDAFKVWAAIAKIEYFSLRYDLSGQIENKFYFSKDSEIWEEILQEGYWGNFIPQKDGSTFSIWTNRFLDKDSFIKYWANKTVDFVRTGTVDFSDLLHPFNRSKYYSQS